MSANVKCQPLVDYLSERGLDCRDLVGVIVPVSFAMLLTAVIISSVPSFSKDLSQSAPELSPFPDTPTRIWQSILFAAFIIVVIAAITFLLLFLYKHKFRRTIFCLSMAGPALMLSIISVCVLYAILIAYNVPSDYFTVAFFSFNFTVVGLLVIFNSGPVTLQHFYLILMSSIMALLFIKIFPSWILWTLVGCAALWDLFAVLNKYGPLKQLVDTADERDEDLMPGMIYNTSIVISEDMNPGGTQLGLGDFVFYSILVGLAATYGDYNATIAVYLAIIIGLKSTIAISSFGHCHTLPALPISVGLALLVFPATYYLITPFVNECSVEQVYI